MNEKQATTDFLKTMVALAAEQGQKFKSEHGRMPTEAEAGRMATELIQQARVAMVMAK